MVTISNLIHYDASLQNVTYYKIRQFLQFLNYYMTKCDSFTIKCDSFYKMRWFYHKMQQLLQHGCYKPPPGKRSVFPFN